jgi:pimeloyl-ACP methyl ester carboxylesterase
LVHGGSDGPRLWARVAKVLAAYHRVYRYTRYTSRATPAPSSPEAMAGEVHDVLAIADTIGRPIVAVGHSSGAVVVLESALESPSRFEGLLLYEPPVAVTKPLGGDALRRARGALAEDDADRAVRIFFREIVGIPHFIVKAMKLAGPVWRRLCGYAPAQIADTEAIESLGVGVERYSALRVPVLLLGGGFLSPAHARARLDALASVLPCVEARITLRVHGHGAHYSAPRKVARIIESFAGRVSRG